MENIITSEDFDSKVTNTNGIVIVDFFATWCGPCKMLGPVFEELSKEMDGVSFFKVDIDKSSDLASKFGITTVPTMMIFKNGKEEDKMIGFMQKEDIKARLNQI